MIPRLLVVLLQVLAIGDAHKFLCYSPLFGQSPVNFLGNIADALIEAGHEVAYVVPEVDKKISLYKSKYESKVFLVEQSPIAKAMDDRMENADAEGMVSQLWGSGSAEQALESFKELYVALADQCNATLLNKELIAQLRAEKFDVAYAESIDLCAFALFDLIGVKKTVITQSFPSMENAFEIHGVETNPSYIPGIGMFDELGSNMDFAARARNTFLHVYFRMWGSEYVRKPIQTAIDQIEDPEIRQIPQLEVLGSRVSLVFLNAEPLLEFPHPVNQRVVEIGGISVPPPKPLDEKWSKILSLRKKTIYISFGTLSLTYLIPTAYRDSILETVRHFPDITFIWKHEEPHRLAGFKDIDNLVAAAWIPQNDLLNDPRLSLFISHCGIGSTMEAAKAGIPVLAVPVMGDQFRNANVLRRAGMARYMPKQLLAANESLINVINEVLDNPQYAEAAKRTAAMIARRPVPMKELLVRNMEFVAEFGPLDHLRSTAHDLYWFQYYLLDIIFVFGVLPILVLIIVGKVVWHMFASSVKIKG